MGPYFVRALLSHSRRLRLLCLRWQTLSAAFNLSARVGVFATGGPAGFPGPVSVALGGVPKAPGALDGAAAHASLDSHAGGDDTGEAKHGEATLHSCASY